MGSEGADCFGPFRGTDASAERLEGLTVGQGGNVILGLRSRL